MRFYNVPANNVGGLSLAVRTRKFAWSPVSGISFDTIGRTPMITATYIISGVLLALTGWLFYAGIDCPNANIGVERDFSLRPPRPVPLI